MSRLLFLLLFGLCLTTAVCQAQSQRIDSIHVFKQLPPGIYTSASANAITGMRRVSRPGQRHYVPAKDIPKVRNGLGIAIISTSQGVMTDKQARDKGVGGEVLCEVW